MSPWVTFDDTSASMKENAHKDYANQAYLKESSIGSAETDEYNVPLSASPE